MGNKFVLPAINTAESRARAAAIERESIAKAAAVAEEVKIKAQESAARNAAIAAKTARSKFHGQIAMALAVAGMSALILDYIIHDYKPFIKWRVRRHLQQQNGYRDGDQQKNTPSKLLPVPSHPFFIHPTTLTMLLAPTGAGKSTLLETTANAAVKEGVPTVLIKFRASPNNDKSVSATAQVDQTSDADPTARMKLVADTLCEQIGYPSRDSLLGWFLRQSWKVRETTFSPVLAPSVRLRSAFVTLFDVCDRLYLEREAQGIPSEKARCIVMLDEVQDLIKDARLAKAGGRDLFHWLAGSMVLYNVDKKTVLIVAAGSSAELNIEFGKTVARKNRWTYYKLPDPTPETVTEALLKQGYNKAEIDELLDACGTRLRLLAGPLIGGKANFPVAITISNVLQNTINDYETVFRNLQEQDRRTLASILDNVATGKSRSYHDLPAALRVTGEHSKILYADLDSRLSFQDRPCEKMWKDPAFRASILSGARLEP